MASDGSPREVELINDDAPDLVFARRGWCAWIPCLGGDRSVCFQRMRPPEIGDDPWWIRGWKRVREWSEIVAGPKWKTFIRRFNRSRPDRAASGCFAYGRLRNHHERTGMFRYDEFSYALNFDHGQNGHLDDDGGGDGDDDLLGRDFSSRYASVPASAKSSMDLGHGAGGGQSFT